MISLAPQLAGSINTLHNAPICRNSLFALDAQTNCGLINFASGR